MIQSSLNNRQTNVPSQPQRFYAVDSLDHHIFVTLHKCDGSLLELENTVLYFTKFIFYVTMRSGVYLENLVKNPFFYISTYSSIFTLQFFQSLLPLQYLNSHLYNLINFLSFGNCLFLPARCCSLFLVLCCCCSGSLLDPPHT